MGFEGKSPTPSEQDPGRASEGAVGQAAEGVSADSRARIAAARDVDPKNSERSLFPDDAWFDDEVVDGEEGGEAGRRDQALARGGMIRFALLALLREQPDYGYQLKRRFEERVGSLWHLNIGQVYQTLRALKRLDLVTEVVAAAHHTPARRLFELTAEGVAVLERWLQKSPVRPQPLRDETLIQLLVLEPARRAEAVVRISEQEHLYKRHLSRLQAQKRRLGRTPVGPFLLRQLGIEGALLHSEAHLKWLEYCRHRIQEGTDSF